MRALQRALVILHGLGQMLFHRCRSGKGGGVQPARHRDDRDASQRHGPQQPDPRTGAAHRRKQAQHIGPEHKDAHGNSSGIGDRGKGRHRPVVIQQGRHPKIGVDARRHRQHPKGCARKRIEPAQMPFEFAGIADAALLMCRVFAVARHMPTLFSFELDRLRAADYQALA